MRPHPRIRKTIKWGGVAATSLFIALWLGSAFASIMIEPVNFVILTVSRGRVGVFDYRFLAVSRTGTRQAVQPTNPVGLNWTMDIHPNSLRWGDVPRYIFPLWPLALISLAGTVAAWRHDRRARLAEIGTCQYCSYSRKGLSLTTPCPECGRPAETTS